MKPKKQKKLLAATSKLLRTIHRKTEEAFQRAGGTDDLLLASGILPPTSIRPTIAILTLTTDKRATSYVVAVDNIREARKRMKRQQPAALPVACLERVDRALPDRALEDPDWMLAGRDVCFGGSLDDLCVSRGLWLANTPDN